MYRSFSIENFRLFDRLTVEPLARVNLIAGQNNSGKTALLEALWLHSAQNNPEPAQRISIWRGLPGSEPGELFSDLFRGYQTDLPIKLISTNGDGGDAETLTITIQPRRESATPMIPTFPPGAQPRRSQSDGAYDTEIVFEYSDTEGNKSRARAWVELPFPPGLRLEGISPALRIERESRATATKETVCSCSLWGA